MSRLNRTCSWAPEWHNPNGCNGLPVLGAVWKVAGWAGEQCRLQAGIGGLRATRVAAVEGCCRTYGSGGSVVMVAEGGVATGQAVDGPRVGG